MRGAERQMRGVGGRDALHCNVCGCGRLLHSGQFSVRGLNRGLTMQPPYCLVSVGIARNATSIFPMGDRAGL